MPLISIITPVLDEEETIGAYMDHLTNLQGEFELILVDGGSEDGTCEEIELQRFTFPISLTLLSSLRGRATQMNAGARAAKGDIFLFLHVDCMIPDDSLEVIEKVCRPEGVAGGAFVQSFSDPDLVFALSSSIVNWFSKYTQTFFGDFGIFIKKDIFSRAGGYDDIPFFEDTELCRSARCYGRMLQIDRVIMSSPRRFKRVGRKKLIGVYILACLLNMLKIHPRYLEKFIVDK